MEGNSMLPGLSPSMLGLEMPLHPHPHQHQQHPNANNTNPKPHHQHQYQQHPQQQQQHHQMVSFASYEPDNHSQSPQPPKQIAFPYPNKVKQQQQQLQIPLSDEEEPGFTGDDGGDGRKQVSSWQRVKWTDSMIRLLIMVVYYVEDDGGHEGNDALGKKRSGGALLQKKGKWKSVSRAMMEKGFFVSPQQCEDKFNDLNKRYKRVNDLLGKGTACKVVENQSLLDTLGHLTPKMKEEARKLLNSKHLFFREMCVYHNNGILAASCGGTGALGAHHQPSHSAAESSHQQHQHQQQQHCFDSRNVGVKGGGPQEDDEDDDLDDDYEDDDCEDEEENQHVGGSGGHEDEEEDAKFSSKKRQRNSLLSPPIQQLTSELTIVLQDGTKSPYEQRQWMRNRMLQLEEQKVTNQYEAFELEKQRLKWVKFREEKERDMDKMKLNNERMKLENERMVLLLRKKELELLDLQQRQSSSAKRPNI